MKFDVRVKIVPRKLLEEPALDSEAAVWRALAAGEDLVVVADDKKLASWVRRIACAYSWEVEQVQDPVEELKSRYPSLAEYAEELVGEATAVEEPVLWNLLNRCDPDLQIVDAPRRDHAEHLVRWRIGRRASPAVLAALKLAIDGWADDELQKIYDLVREEDLAVLVEHVVGVKEPAISSSAERQWIEEPVRAWARRQLAAAGFDGVRGVFLSAAGFEARTWVAEEVALSDHLLDQEDVNLLRPFLSGALRDRLERRKPPPAPGVPPEPGPDGQALSDWYERRYLPYRSWMHANGIPVDAAAEESWTAFADLARTLVKKGFGSGQGPLAALLSRRQRLEAERVGERHLLVVLDGPLPSDVDEFLVQLTKRAEGWKVASRRWTLSALPTVTEVCRPAVVTGTDRLSGHEDTAVCTFDEVRSSRQESRFIVLKATEPDQSYHRFAENPEAMRENAAQALERLTKKLAKLLVEGRCDRLFVTADHGRCFGPCRPDVERPPGDMHGRAVLNVPKGTPVPDGAERLDGGAYQFSHDSDAIVALGNRCFRDAAETWYLHGGMLPEEVMVPWVEFAHVPAKIEVELSASLTGEQNGPGVLVVRMNNASKVDVTCVWAGFASDCRLQAEACEPVRIGRASSGELRIPIRKIEGELPNKGRVRLRTPAGDVEEREVGIADEVKKLMEQNLSLADEFDLD